MKNYELRYASIKQYLLYYVYERKFAVVLGFQSKSQRSWW